VVLDDSHISFTPHVQDLVASVMIVGTVLELLIPVIETICQIIPDPVCFLGCFTNPFRFGCFIIVGIARVILQVYKFFEVSTHLFAILVLLD
jgi:hypothetical protein